MEIQKIEFLYFWKNWKNSFLHFFNIYTQILIILGPVADAEEIKGGNFRS